MSIIRIAPILATLTQSTETIKLSASITELAGQIIYLTDTKEFRIRNSSGVPDGVSVYNASLWDEHSFDDYIDQPVKTASNVVFHDVQIDGDLILKGTIDVYDTQILQVVDHTIEMGKLSTPTDTSADGGGIRLLGTTDKTILWDLANKNWTSSENFNLASGKVFKIGNIQLNSSMVPESATNKYFTDARARAALSGGDGITYNTSTGVFSLANAIGNSTGNIPLNNGTLNTDLNADKLDNKHASDFALSGHNHNDDYAMLGGTPSFVELTVTDSAAIGCLSVGMVNASIDNKILLASECEIGTVVIGGITFNTISVTIGENTYQFLKT